LGINPDGNGNSIFVWISLDQTKIREIEVEEREGKKLIIENFIHSDREQQ
jgi:hypothetical protein